MIGRIFMYYIFLCLHLTHLKLTAGYGAREQLWLEVISPSDVAFAYKIRPARNFGDVITKPYRNIRLVPTQPEEGCSQIINGERLKGQVAFIKRGGCSFVSKSVNAELYGAVAVVITDSDPNENTNWIDMIGDGTERENNIGIPAFFMMGKDGHMISESLQRHATSSALINIPVNFTNTALIRQPPWDFW